VFIANDTTEQYSMTQTAYVIARFMMKFDAMEKPIEQDNLRKVSSYSFCSPDKEYLLTRTGLANSAFTWKWSQTSYEVGRGSSHSERSKLPVLMQSTYLPFLGPPVKASRWDPLFPKCVSCNGRNNNHLTIFT
jgi:hypothetical protein